MGEPKGAAIWNRTPKPSMHTQGMQKSYEQENRVAGAAYVSSHQLPNRSEKMTGSGPTTSKVGKKARSTGGGSPSQDPGHLSGMYHGL